MSGAPLSRAARLYVAAVVMGGAIPVAWSVAALLAAPADPRWLLLAALTVLVGALAVRLPAAQAMVSLPEAFAFASAFLFGPAPATLTVVLDGLVVSLRSRRRRVYRMLFNLAEPGISVWISAQLFHWLAGADAHAAGFWRLFGPLLVMTTSYFVLNTGLTTVAMALEARTSPIALLRSCLPCVSLNYLASTGLTALVVHSIRDLTAPALGVLVLLQAVAYATARAAIARLEDANRHVEQLNRLYLSTVETLAMAIDAKDQVTHGHLRRVQVQSVRLARALGVDDERELKAIEAAALLHDLGKLAVPEHILNKRAALTPLEREQIRAHPEIGEAILSAIDFPYPVAPIVRHHHEHWDGSGYPDGLSGEAIPLGARILAVVDCFDALTSDRPYRRGMSEEEALRIIRSRRGRMYDPRVVDRFVEIYPSLRDAVPAEPPASPFEALKRPVGARRAGTVATASAREDREIAVRAFAASLGAACTWEELAGALGRFVAGLLPSAATVLYVVDEARGRLAAVGRPGLEIDVGRGASGWAARTGDVVVNAAAALDLGAAADDAAGAADLRAAGLQAVVAAPLTRRGRVVAVLAVYSSDPWGVPADGAWQIELVAAELSGRLASGPAIEASEAGAPRGAAHLRRIR
jgi:putative nucleotidyltransferase with HDIG domain